jgi:hypothetical protein
MRYVRGVETLDALAQIVDLLSERGELRLAVLGGRECRSHERCGCDIAIGIRGDDAKLARVRHSDKNWDRVGC